VLPLDALAEADLLTNQDTGLHAKTTPAELGACDAFVTHSWQDDGAAKFESLGAWAKKFVVEERSPTIWLDKASIDQGDIDANLAALPIFLSACKELLVLSGVTYPTRLWCVMELFTFLRMGGNRERMNVVELGGVEGRAALARFDASKAQCFLKRDREKLLAVIEAGFGDLKPFNKIVRGILAERRVEMVKMAVGATTFVAKLEHKRKAAAEVRYEVHQDEGAASQKMAVMSCDPVVPAAEGQLILSDDV